MCITVPNIVKIGRTVAIGLQDGGHPPSSIFKMAAFCHLGFLKI